MNSKILTIACIIIAIIFFSLHGVFNFATTIGAAAILPPLLMLAHKKDDKKEVEEFVPFWLVSSTK